MRRVSWLLLLLGLGGVTLAQAQVRAVTTPTVEPAQVKNGVAERVRIWADISDPNVIASGVNLLKVGAPGTNPAIVGVLKDDGTDGDEIAGDGRYTIELTVNEPTTKTFVYRISAPFKGTLLRTVTPDLTLAVVANRVPVAVPGVNRAVRTGARVQLDGRDSYDLDGDLLRFRWTLTRPAGSAAVLDSANYVKPSFTADLAGSYRAQLVVNDGQVDSVAQELTITATAGNAAPTARLSAMSLRFVAGAAGAPASVPLAGGGSDPEGQPLTYAWALKGKPATSTAASLSAPSGPTPLLLADQPGRYRVELTVDDGTTAGAPVQAVIALYRPNTPPTASTGADPAAQPTGSLVSLGGTASDADGDSVTAVRWTFIARPANSTAVLDNPTTSTPSFTADQPGDYLIEFSATDSRGATGRARVVVRAVSLPPVTISSLIANPGSGTVPLTVQFQSQASGGTGTFGYGWTFGDSGVASTQNPSHTYTLPGSHIATVTATDTQNTSAQRSVTIVANPVASGNQPPQVNAGPNQGLVLPARATLTGSATDDGLPNPPGALTTTWSMVSGPSTGVVFGNPAAPATTASFTAPGIYVLRLTASDGQLSASATVQITVSDGAPQLDAIADRTIEAGNRLQIVVLARDGNANEKLTYALTTAPAGATLNPAPLIDWAPTVAQVGRHPFTVRVTDSAGNAATTAFNVTVVHVNKPPQLGPQASLITPVGTTFARTLTAADPDAGDALTFALVAGPAGMTLNGATLNWSTLGKSPGDYLVTVQVTDSGGLSDSKQFTVTLTPAPPGPVAKDDRYSVRLGETLTIAAPGILGNDLSLSGQPLTALKITDPTKGILNNLSANGGFSYTAPATLPPRALNPVVSLRGINGGSTVFQYAADFDRDGKADYVSSDFGNFRAWRGSDGAQLWQFDPNIATHVDLTGCTFFGFANSEFALGDVTGNGEIDLIMPISCTKDIVGGSTTDRLVAINTSAISPTGKVAARWLSPRLSQPHPGAYEPPAGSALPNPPAYPGSSGGAYRTLPTLAKITPTGSTKILLRKLWTSTEGYYFATSALGTYTYAACRTATGLVADEGRPCKATYVLNASTGAVENVLTAPNNADESQVDYGPTTNSPPIVADLEGDGQVEIVSGGDVWKLVNGTWTLAWQAMFESNAGILKAFEPDSVAVADLDGDGKAEVIMHLLPTSNSGVQALGWIYIFGHDGTLQRKIPLENGLAGMVSVADVDGDGAPEILLPFSGVLYAYHGDGSLLWAKQLSDEVAGVTPVINQIQPALRSNNSPVYAYDLDLDGVPEVIVQGSRRLFILNGRTGAEIWSIDTETDGYRNNATPMLVDADGDGHVDIVLNNRNRWNCSVLTGGPVDCTGGTFKISGGDLNWAPGPKVQNQMNFRASAINDSAVIRYDASVRRDFRQQIQQGTAIDPRVSQGTSFTYKANDGTLDSAPATVQIDIKPLNRPPVITSIPPTAFAETAPAGTIPTVYTIRAVDPDPGDSVHYEFVSAQGRHYFLEPTVDSATGAVNVPVCGAPCGGRLITIVVAAVDSFGARTEQSMIINFTPYLTAVPNVVGQSIAAARTLLEPVPLTPLVVAEVFNSAAAGIVLAQDPAAGSPGIPQNATVRLTVSKGPAPTLVPFVVGDTLSVANARLAALGFSRAVTPVFSTTIPVNQVMSQTPNGGTEWPATPASPVSLTVSAGPPLALPIASIVVEPGPGPLLRLAGDELPFKATAVFSDGTSADITLTAAWASATTSAATVSSIGLAKAIGSGSTTISATLGAKTGLVTLNVVARALGDNTPPTAAITSPADGGSVTGPTAIVGTASDANFLRYELAIALAGDDNYTVIAEGTSPVTNGTLGTLDPTVLVNDLYTLRLKVFDRSENASVATTTVQLTGNRKIGLFSLAFNDLTIPMSGIPLTVTRTYDSRDKTRGDFGIGWRLGLQTLRLRANRVLGTGWLRTVSGPAVSLAPTAEHKVSITLADGRVEEFDMIVSPTSNLGSLDFTNVTGFQPRSGTLGQLQALANNSLLIVNGVPQDELVDDTTLNTYSPTLYRYTTVDGTQIEISPTAGVKKVTDLNGNTITFGPGGIIHSAGKSVIFTRDLQGRITQITDPLGNVQNYTYDGNGDLVAHANAVGSVSRYAYNRSHGLIDIQDPAGNHSARNDYDASGRLIATTDANGNQITYAHNSGASQEVIRDRRGNPTAYSYDSNGNVVAKTNALGQTWHYTFDSLNNQLTQTDPLGRVASSTYDGQGNVLTATDFNGNTTTSSYNSRGQVLTVTNPEGRTRSNVYDAAGNLVRVSEPGGSVTTYTYDLAGRRLSVADPLNKVTTYTYDASGNRISETDPLGRTSRFTYDANGRTLNEIDPNGAATSLTYDAAGRPIRRVDKLGNAVLIAYSSVGDGTKIASQTSATGQITRFEYDALGNATKITYPDGSFESNTYDAENHPVSKTDRDGRTTTFQFDALGRQTRTTHPDGAVALRSYDAVGRLLVTTDERGNRTSYSYVPNQQTVTDALGNATVHRFDSLFRPLSTADALGRVTNFVYDSAGNPVQTIYADGTSKTTSYDATRRKTTETDQAGRATQFAYDAAGQLTRVTDAAGGITVSTYNALGDRLTQTDANGHQTRMTYDALGRLSTRAYPSGAQESFVYDADGNQVSHTDFNGRTTTFSFDRSKRLIQKNLPGGRVVAYAYTASGSRTQADGDSYTYDPRGRLTTERKASGDTLSYTYDPSGNRTSVITPLGTTTYTYDAMNRIATVTDSAGATSYGYDAVGNLTATSYPNGITTAHLYDALNRLTRLTNTKAGGLVSSYTYSLGPAGNRTQVVEAGSATTGRTASYSFDALYRLTAEQVTEPGSGTETVNYAYDPVGNRTRVSRGGIATLQTYDVNDRLLSQTDGSGTVTSSYDDNGNLKTRSGGAIAESYVYDAENRLLSAVTAAGAINYTYDADGVRTSAAAGGVTTSYLADKNRDYAQVLVERAGAAATTYTYGHLLINQARAGEGTHFYLTDGQISVRQLTDTAGAVSDSYTYDAFGQQLRAVGGTSNAYRYAGEQLDSKLGSYYLRARYYAPRDGRFISTDPKSGNVFEPVSLHRYLYANNNPVDMRDPSGEEPSLVSVAVTSALTAGLTGVVINTGAYGLKVAFGRPYSAADLARAVFSGFFTGAAAGLAGAVVGVPAALLASATMNTANTLLDMHRARDVTVTDLVGNLGLNFFIGGALTLGGDTALRAVEAAIYATVTGQATSEIFGAATEELRPVGSTILWRKKDRCPNGHSYTVNAAGKYAVYGSLPNLGCDYASWIYHLYARK